MKNLRRRATLLLKSGGVLSENQPRNISSSSTPAGLIMKLESRFGAFFFTAGSKFQSKCIGFGHVGICIYWIHPTTFFIVTFFVFNQESKRDSCRVVAIRWLNITTRLKSKYDMIRVNVQVLNQMTMINMFVLKSIVTSDMKIFTPCIRISLKLNNSTKSKSYENSVATMAWQLNSY